VRVQVQVRVQEDRGLNVECAGFEEAEREFKKGAQAKQAEVNRDVFEG
jgi:hypothetical protein